MSNNEYRMSKEVTGDFNLKVISGRRTKDFIVQNSFFDIQSSRNGRHANE